MATSAVEKVNADKKIKIIESLAEGIPWANAGDSMVVSTPKEVNQIMAQIPKGKVVTITELRGFLAKRHGTDITCPISTGIFITLAAKAAQEMEAEGIKGITPFWRVLKKDGELNQKFPAFPDKQRALLEVEGFAVVQKRKRYFVEDYQDRLFNFEGV